MSKMNLDELRKSLEDLDFSPEEIDAIIEKAEKEADTIEKEVDVDEEEKEQETEEQEEDEEEETEEEEEVEKSIQPDILKSLRASNNRIMKSLTRRLSTQMNEELEEFKKGIRDDLSEIKKSLNKIGSTPMPRRGISHQSILEKGLVDRDEDGKTILSVSSQKDDVIKAIEGVIEKSTDVGRRGRFERALLHYNMGGAAIPQDIAQELFTSENIRLVH